MTATEHAETPDQIAARARAELAERAEEFAAVRRDPATAITQGWRHALYRQRRIMAQRGAALRPLPTGYGRTEAERLDDLEAALLAHGWRPAQLGTLRRLRATVSAYRNDDHWACYRCNSGDCTEPDTYCPACQAAIGAAR